MISWAGTLRLMKPGSVKSVPLAAILAAEAAVAEAAVAVAVAVAGIVRRVGKTLQTQFASINFL